MYRCIIICFPRPNRPNLSRTNNKSSDFLHAWDPAFRVAKPRTHLQVSRSVDVTLHGRLVCLLIYVGVHCFCVYEQFAEVTLLMI